MRKARPLLPFALPLVLLAGCAQLQRKPVQVERVSGCPEQTVDALNAGQNELGPLSETHTLACALDFLRHTHDPTLLRGSLGSRLCLYLAERENDKNQREKLASEGVRFAETAIALGGENDGAVHYYLSANLGLAVRDHFTLAMENLPRLEAEMKRALELSPDVDDGGPLRLLGMLYLKAPPWPSGIGDGDKALALLKQAVDKHPGHPLNHLFYAQALWGVEENAAAGQVNEHLARGMQLLLEDRWGYRKTPWAQEFAEFRQEIDALAPGSGHSQ